MRRLLALLLLCSFGLAPGLSAAASGQQSTVPACCRRDGKHHCGKHEPLKRAFRSIEAKCPCAPVPAGLYVATDFLLPPASRANACLLTAHTAGSGPADSFRLTALYDAHQKRGPPSLV